MTGASEDALMEDLLSGTFGGNAVKAGIAIRICINKGTNSQPGLLRAVHISSLKDKRQALYQGKGLRVGGGKKKKGGLSIECYLTAHSLFSIVTDDGKGAQKNRLMTLKENQSEHFIFHTLSTAFTRSVIFKVDAG